MTVPETQNPLRPFDDAMARLKSEIKEGLMHGFFDFGVSCEILKGGKRQLTVQVGKSYRFVIPKEDIQN